MHPSTFAARCEVLHGGRGQRYALTRDAVPLTRADVLGLWIGDENFRAFFLALVADAPFRALRLETPPVTSASLERPFELVLLDSPGIALPADATDFAEHFDDEHDVAVFPNLGKDALLVVPVPRAGSEVYSHLAAFTRNGPPGQNHALWRTVAETVVARVGARPLWLSTAGGGVPWLHVRLDSRPKYYGHAPYRETGV